MSAKGLLLAIAGFIPRKLCLMPNEKSLYMTKRLLKFEFMTDASVVFKGMSDSNNLSLALAKCDYEDMGKPEYVTVTIEPGDRLNQEEIKVSVTL